MQGPWARDGSKHTGSLWSARYASESCIGDVSFPSLTFGGTPPAPERPGVGVAGTPSTGQAETDRRRAGVWVRRPLNPWPGKPIDTTDRPHRCEAGQKRGRSLRTMKRARSIIKGVLGKGRMYGSHRRRYYCITMGAEGLALAANVPTSRREGTWAMPLGAGRRVQ